MTARFSLALLAIAVVSVEASAQVSTTERVRDRVMNGDRRTDTRTDTRRTGTIGDIIFGRASDERSGTSKVPKGHLPPRGMCRVWIEGVPPGQQPAVTSCAQAERDRIQYGANARVIYGDRESFPGKGKGKFKNRDHGTTTDILGRRVGDDDDDDRWDDDDDDRRNKGAKGQKSQKGRGKGKKG